MKNWGLAITVAFFAAVSVAAGAVALTDDGGGSDSGTRLAHDADNGDESSGGDGSVTDCGNPPCEGTDGGGAAGICLEGTVNCIDTPSEKPPEGDVCIQIFPTPPECADPDEPVSNEPPPVLEEPAPNECVVVGSGAADWYSAACEKAAIALAIEDLSLRLGSPQAITVQSAEFVQWPDSCLGIAKTDVACAEVITPGFRIILAVGENTFEYHAAGATRAELLE